MQVLNVTDVTKKLKISRPTVYSWIKNEGFPKPFHAGGKSYWDEADINNWLTSKKEMEYGSSSRETESQPVGADV